METEILDKLYLEISQFTTARTGKEIALESFISQALYALALRIERCGASVPLTNAVVFCSDLRESLTSNYPSARHHAQQRIARMMAEDQRGRIDGQGWDATGEVGK